MMTSSITAPSIIPPAHVFVITCIYVRTGMAEVFSSNFTTLLPRVVECIENSEFVAIDTEFTGLSVSVEDEPSLFDSVHDRYQKVKSFAHSFITLVSANLLLPPAGLSAFVKDPNVNRYTAHTFNFYLLPRPQGTIDTRFLFQASNAEFLCEYEFDFNKLFYSGISYLNEEQEAEFRLGEHDEKKIHEALGFTLVFRALVRSRKPLLGHNMLSDLALMYEKCHRPLPDTYAEFKQSLHQLFPLIVDTKSMCYGVQRSLAQTNLLQFTSLFDLYEALGSERGTFYVLCSPDIIHAETSEKYISQRRYHEAGFDAFCVGFVFLRVSHLLAMKGLKSTEAHAVHINQYFRIMEPHSNRINVIRGPIKFINLIGEDRPSYRSDWLVVQSRSGEFLSTKTLHDQLGEFGSMDVQFFPHSPSKAVVVLQSQRRALRILEERNEALVVRRFWWARDSPKAKQLFRRLLWTGLGAGIAGIIAGMLLPRLRHR